MENPTNKPLGEDHLRALLAALQKADPSEAVLLREIVHHFFEAQEGTHVSTSIDGERTRHAEATAVAIAELPQELAEWLPKFLQKQELGEIIKGYDVEINQTAKSMCEYSAQLRKKAEGELPDTYVQVWEDYEKKVQEGQWRGAMLEALIEIIEENNPKQGEKTLAKFIEANKDKRNSITNELSEFVEATNSAQYPKGEMNRQLNRQVQFYISRIVQLYSFVRHVLPNELPFLQQEDTALQSLDQQLDQIDTCLHKMGFSRIDIQPYRDMDTDLLGQREISKRGEADDSLFSGLKRPQKAVPGTVARVKRVGYKKTPHGVDRTYNAIISLVTNSK